MPLLNKIHSSLSNLFVSKQPTAPHSFSDRVNAFAVQHFQKKETSCNHKNFLFTPLNRIKFWALLHAGALYLKPGHSQIEIEDKPLIKKFLNMDGLSDEEMHSKINQLIHSLQSSDQPNTAVLQQLQLIATREDTCLSKQLQSSTHYQYEHKPLSSSEEIAKWANQRINELTKGAISTILNGPPDRLALFVATIALMKLTCSFSPDNTKYYTFYNSDGTDCSIPMMYTPMN